MRLLPSLAKLPGGAHAARSAGNAEPRHVIFMCLVFYPDTSATSILFTDLFRRLSRGGRARITVLCAFPSKADDDVATDLPREEWVDGIHIIRCGLRIDGKASLRARALSYSSFLLHAGWKLLQIGPGAIVLGGTDPPFTSIALWILSLTRRFSYQCVLLDVYPDLLVGLGTLPPGSPIVRIWRALNGRSRRAAERLIVIGRDMKERLVAEGIDGGRIVYIPHWATSEVDRLADTSSRPLLDRLGLAEKFVVQYSGNMGLLHDMVPFVQAAERLRHEDDIHFLFIGKGRRRAEAEALSQRLRLANVTWLNFLPRGHLAESLISCDTALISLRAGLEGTAVPSKLYGILASGRPVIAQVPRTSEIAYAVEEERCGIVVNPGDVDGLADAVCRLAREPQSARDMGERAREAYRSKYTIDAAVEAFTDLWDLDRTPYPG